MIHKNGVFHYSHYQANQCSKTLELINIFFVIAINTSHDIKPLCIGDILWVPRVDLLTSYAHNEEQEAFSM